MLKGTGRRGAHERGISSAAIVDRVEGASCLFWGRRRRDDVRAHWSSQGKNRPAGRVSTGRLSMAYDRTRVHVSPRNSNALPVDLGPTHSIQGWAEHRLRAVHGCVHCGLASLVSDLRGNGDEHDSPRGESTSGGRSPMEGRAIAGPQDTLPDAWSCRDCETAWYLRRAIGQISARTRRTMRRAGGRARCSGD